MNSVVPISASEQRLEIASRWILKMDEGLTEADREGLKVWLAEHPQNTAELLDVAKIWDKMENLSRLADLFPADLFTHEPAAQDGQAHERARPALWTRRRFSTRSVVAAAASLVVVVTAAFLLLPELDLDSVVADRLLAQASAAHSYETAIGEQSTVVLPDGTVVILNTNSRISVAYSSAARVLQLHRGEIHVDVAKDLARPLSVVAGDRILQAVGTSFSVEITEDSEIELVVTEGKVVVGIRSPGDLSLGNRPMMVPPLLAQTDSNTVIAGEELLLGAPDAVITPVSAEELEVKLSWREGRLIFRGEPLEEALAEVERYTTIEFVFLDEDLKSRSVSGRYRAGDVEALLIALRLNFNITHEYSGADRVLLSSL